MLYSHSPSARAPHSEAAGGGPAAEQGQPQQAGEAPGGRAVPPRDAGGLQRVRQGEALGPGRQHHTGLHTYVHVHTYIHLAIPFTSSVEEGRSVCPGEELTYTCTILGGAAVWRVPCGDAGALALAQTKWLDNPPVPVECGNFSAATHGYTHRRLIFIHKMCYLILKASQGTHTRWSLNTTSTNHYKHNPMPTCPSNHLLPRYTFTPP